MMEKSDGECHEALSAPSQGGQGTITMTRTSAVRGLFSGVNRPLDGRNLTDLERMHAPAIGAPDAVRVGEPFSVSVRMGSPAAHPSEHRHFVAAIGLYADDLPLATAQLTAGNALPEVTFRVCLAAPAKELRAFGQCNMHGTWVGARPIAVRPAEQHHSGPP
jgi:superoxide reductase